MGATGARGHETAEAEHLCKKLAFQVQADLDEYIANNPDFQVGLALAASPDEVRGLY